MDATKVFEALLNETSSREDIELCELFASHLRQRDWHVYENTEDLKEFAMESCDLVEA